MPNVAGTVHPTSAHQATCSRISKFRPERPLKASLDTLPLHSSVQQTHEIRFMLFHKTSYKQTNLI